MINPMPRLRGIDFSSCRLAKDHAASTTSKEAPMVLVPLRVEPRGSIKIFLTTTNIRQIQVASGTVHFRISTDFIYLNDFNLVTFTYKGPAVELYLSNLPDLKVVDIGDGVLEGLENNVFSQIAFCLSYLQVLSLDIHRPKESLKLGTIPKLPMIKNLKLTIGAQRDDCLLKLTSIDQACPILEVLTIQLNWLLSIRRRRKVRRVGDHPHEHLKQLKFVGYYGRGSDLELVMYVMVNAVGIKKILIDPCGSTRRGTTTVVASIKAVEAARSIAKRQPEKSITCDRGLEFVIL